jgi:peptidyl-tRNA hydrolase, PTH1 family
MFGFLGRRQQLAPDENVLTYLLVGLGNPGREYRANRHNLGFMTVDQLSQVLSIRLSRVQSKALVGIGVHDTNKVILAKPQTFMNLSGQAVSSLLRFYKIPLERLLVLHDELDLPLGTLRLRPGGGSAGNRGLASIIQQLGTQEFPRLRIGVGHPPGQMSGADYVLQDFPPAEQELLEMVLKRAVEAAQVFIKSGLETAMNQYNGSLQKD